MSAPLPDLGCACATVRRTARLVTQLYSKELGPDIEPGQFSTLAALNEHPGLNQSKVGYALGLDKTTMSRNLRVMEKKGWIEPSPGGDRRERSYCLTPAGRKVYVRAKPGWVRAQAQLRSSLKRGEWENMFEVFNRVSAAVNLHCDG